MKNLLIIFFAIAFHTTAFAQPAVGTKVADFSLPDAAGQMQSLSALKGKVVLIDFWASWCRPCRVSNKQMQPLYNKYKSKGFEILGISVDERKGAWLHAIKADKIKWLQVIDPQASSGSRVMEFFNIQFLPTTFLLDTEGVVIAINPVKEELEAWLKKLL